MNVDPNAKQLFENALNEAFVTLQIGPADKNLRKAISKAAKRVAREVREFVKQKMKQEKKLQKKRQKKERVTGKQRKTHRRDPVSSNPYQKGKPASP
jgi:dsDNA-specific endonuclease/ATPase MutS2